MEDCHPFPSEIHCTDARPASLENRVGLTVLNSIRMAGVVHSSESSAMATKRSYEVRLESRNLDPKTNSGAPPEVTHSSEEAGADNDHVVRFCSARSNCSTTAHRPKRDAGARVASATTAAAAVNGRQKDCRPRQHNSSRRRLWKAKYEPRSRSTDPWIARGGKDIRARFKSRYGRAVE